MDLIQAAQRHPKVRLDLIFFGLFLLQLTAIFLVTQPWLRSSDSARYLSLAGNLARGFYSPDGVYPDAIWAPGYPLFLATLRHFLALPVGAIVALQLALIALMAVLVSRRLEGWTRTVFLIFCAGYPMLALYTSAIMSEALALVALTACALLLQSKITPGRLALAGLACGLGALIRADLALLPFVIAGFSAWRGQWRYAPVPLVTAALILLPYAIWNSSTHGRFTPLPAASAVGTSLYLSTWQQRLPLQDLNAVYDGRITPAAQAAGLGDEVRRINRSIGAPELSPIWNPMLYATPSMQMKLNAALVPAALERIEAEPTLYARHVVRNVWALWNTSEYPPQVPSFIAILLALSSGTIFLLGLVGAWFERRTISPYIMLYLPAVHVSLHTEARYTAPARMLLLMLAAIATMRIWAFAQSALVARKAKAQAAI